MDFNDQIRESGPELVRAAIDNARAHVPEPPLPLVPELPPPPAYPVEALGQRLEAAARAIQAVTQAPIDICANAVLAAACLSVQGHANVRLPTQEEKPLSLYIVTIARSGERKTSVDFRALAGVKSREKQLHQIYQDERESHLVAYAAWEQQRAQISRKRNLSFQDRTDLLAELGSAPPPPITPVLVAPEPTLEGLIKMLIHGQPSVGIFTSEGGLFVGGHGLSDEAKLRTAGGLSVFWDDGNFTRTRAGDGVNAVFGRRIAMHLQLQPEVARRLLSDRVLRDQGFLSRLLVCEPETTMGTRFWNEPEPSAWEEVARFQDRTLEFLRRPLPLRDGSANELAPPSLPFTSEGREVWIAYANHVEYRLRPGGELEPISGFAAKLPEHAARIAGVQKKFEDPDADEIDASTLERAILLAEYYAESALRLHGNSQIHMDLINARILLDWLHEKWPETLVSVRVIVRKGPNALRQTPIARRLVQILVEHRWLVPIEGTPIVDGHKVKDSWSIVRSTASSI